MEKLKLDVPTTLIARIVMMREDYRDEVLVYGFINESFASSEYENIQRLPKYLIQLISQWICNEWLHLICPATGQQWKIHIDALLTCVTHT